MAETVTPAPTTVPDGNNIATPDPVVAPDADQKKLQAAHDMAQAEARKANKLVADQTARIKELEAKADETPKADSERLAALEVENARSKAALKHGLSMDDAEVLKGTPAEIESQAEYWAAKLKAKGVTTDTTTDTSVKAVIDKKVADAVTTDTKPQPKTDGKSWFDEYNSATPARRYEMDEACDAGLVDPTTGFKPKS